MSGPHRPRALGLGRDRVPTISPVDLKRRLDDGDLAHIAAAELARTTALPVQALGGGTRAWTMAGYPLASGDDRMAETTDDVWLLAREQGGDRESGMRAYLVWEIDLE